MPNERDIRRAAEYTDRWLMARQRKHVQMVEKSVTNLQNSILNSIAKLHVNNTGKVEGIRVNLKQSQRIHKDIEIAFQNGFNKDTKKIINDFSGINNLVKRSYSYLNVAVNFSGADKQVFDILRDGYYRDYLDISARAKNKIIQEVYNNVIANGEFSSLVNTVEQQLLGSASVSATGRPLVQYSRLYARDMLMNFHNEVNVKKSEDAGLTSFLYIGDIIATTRDFCKTRAGKVYTKNQIISWNYKWAGKSGPALTHRGGYNCRHHWQGVDPSWLKGKKKIEIQDWNLEQRQGG